MIATNGSVAICPRTEAGSKKFLDGSGYLHVVDPSIPMPDRKDEQGVELPEHNLVMSTLASKMMQACDDERLGVFSDQLGVSRASLRMLRAGWSANSDAFSFPMYRAGQRVIGIRLRSVHGKKWAIKGSRQGLFMPSQWPSQRRGIIVCEGPTDTAAMLTLGFNAIGRPSAMGSHALVEEAVAGKSVCIVCDRDEVGLASAVRLAEHLRRSKACPMTGIIVPPAKDAREWVRSGATRESVLTVVSLALKSDGPLYCR
jgi:5S rRNA maturation endonuclease (ribonuclease M5)